MITPSSTKAIRRGGGRRPSAACPYVKECYAVRQCVFLEAHLFWRDVLCVLRVTAPFVRSCSPIWIRRETPPNASRSPVCIGVSVIVDAYRDEV